MHTEKDKCVRQTNVQSLPQPAVFCSQNERKSCDYSPFGVKAKRLTGPRPPAVGRAICLGLFFFPPLPTNRMLRHKEDKWRGFSESKSTGRSGTEGPVVGHGGLIA